MVLVASLILISYFEPELFLQNIRSIVIKRYFGILIIDPLLDLMERLKCLDLTFKINAPSKDIHCNLLICKQYIINTITHEVRFTKTSWCLS